MALYFLSPSSAVCGSSFRCPGFPCHSHLLLSPHPSTHPSLPAGHPSRPSRRLSRPGQLLCPAPAFSFSFRLFLGHSHLSPAPCFSPESPPALLSVRPSVRNSAKAPPAHLSRCGNGKPPHIMVSISAITTWLLCSQFGFYQLLMIKIIDMFY